MGHGSDSHNVKTNPHAIQESDQDLPYRIRSIELIKHNPNLFHVSNTNLAEGYKIFGGFGALNCGIAGGLFGYWYYSQKIRLNPTTFYLKIMLSFSRIALGTIIGYWIGYLKFGDRQRLHNAWVAERLRRRYPECMNLDTQDLWKFKGVKAGQEYYRWT